MNKLSTPQNAATQNQRLAWITVAVASLLIIPFVAMQFTNEIKWSLFDFIAAAILLFSSALAVEFALRKTKKTTYRIMACTIIVMVLAIVWAELAVGIFGSGFAGN